MESEEVLYWKKKKQIDEELLEQARENQEARFGFGRIEGEERTGWLLNMQPTTMEEKETGITRMAIDYYFIQDDGSTFKVTVPHCPYIYLDVKEKFIPEVEAYLKRKYEGVQNIQSVDKEDLEMPNHLNGLRKRYLKVSFHTIKDLLNMRKDLLKIIDANRKKRGLTSAYDGDLGMRNVYGEASKANKHGSVKEHIIDIREADVPYYIRCAIDHGIRVGLWYDIIPVEGGFELHKKEDEHRPEPRICAFDIETTKLPLKFPDPAIDRVMMISYMLDGQGYLIVNREIITEDIDDFEYTPKPEYPGPFTVWNEDDEVALLRRFFDHMKEVKPNIYVTFNGDYFDWPFIERRAEVHGISMFNEIGMCDRAKEGTAAEYRSRFASHMDAFKWVKRDSYLPQGSQGLKAVTKAKLGYDPLELDPEDMVPLASRDPRKLASYSVSDAVCTYYLYMQYVHPFIFSLCNILPMNPDDVLRKGSGTLCETLLMVEAFVKNIIYPNKQESDPSKTFKGHLLESETYIGGHVECLESGVFRKDLPIKLRINKKHVLQLIGDLEGALEMELEVNGLKRDDASNFDAVRDEIASQLSSLLSLEEDGERIKEKEELRKKNEGTAAMVVEDASEGEWLYVKTLPIIMHLDVAAMYPNIILTNRLQPSAIVSSATCAVCDFNKPGATCQRKMNWTWKGEYIPATRTEYELVKSKLETEWIQKGIRLPEIKQRKEIQKRLKQYSQAVYKKQKIKEEQEREAIVCMRENPFYVDTVRAFRDRRYTYKNSLKVWQGKLKSAENARSEADMYTAKGRVILYDSLQLAHKCILNSFYGYVMRRGARWYSMEMAGVVTHTGAQIITKARQSIEQLGRPLELDTDGIWCALPELFPMTFDFKIKSSGKSHIFMYPCTMLNKLVADYFTNHQYHITDPDNPEQFEIKKECSVLFEGDGPYKAMILPASKEEGKLIKKRYAVFDKFDRLVELKGFEVKRRGELRMIKVFQAEVFEKFLEGKTLEDCYAAVGKVANDYLDLLYHKGSKLPDEELLDLISESRNMSKTLAEYGTQKSTSITTAKRLGEFLGLEMIQEKGITCKYIIAKKPGGAQVTDRAVPVKIFASEVAPERRQYFLKKWCQDERMTHFSIRDIIDWDYYIERLGGTIQKIITIPAALQNVENPVPRVVHPTWLIQRLKEHKQTRINSHFFFVKKIGGKDNDKGKDKLVGDIEDGLMHLNKGDDDGDLVKFPPKAIVRLHKRGRNGDEELEDDAAGGVVPSSPQREPERKKTKGKSKADEEEELLEQEETTPEPDKDEDYAGWLRWKKRQWKRMRMLRKLRRKEGALPADSLAKGVGGNSVVSYIRRQRAALLEGTWEIVEIRPLPTSAHHFRMWVLVGDALHSLTLEVPRLYYINYRKAPSPHELPPNATKVDKVALPRNTEVQHLYQVQATELEYQGMLLDVETRQTVEGIYETQTPLLFRALVHAGAVCRLTPAARKDRRRHDSDIFSLLELDFVPSHGGFSGTAAPNAVTGSAQLYLSNKADRYHSIYLYCSFSTDGKRGMIGIFPSWAPPGSEDERKQAHVLVIHPYSRNVTATRGVEKRFSDKLSEMDHDVQRFTSVSEALRSVNRRLKEYKDQSHKPTVLITQTAVDEDRLESFFPAMREFPRASIAGNERDNNYPPLAWEDYAADVLISRFRDSLQWWESQVGMCNYANVPIGNMTPDFPVLVSDILFARMLKRDNQVLWAAERERPDFAGKEGDDNFFDSMATTDEMLYPEVVTPDCYSCVCAELDIHSLAMNTVLESNRIHEIEGTAADSVVTFSFTGGDVLKVDEASGCGKAYGMLKTLLSRWATDYGSGGEGGNKYADVLITHFYRWLSNTRSLLYDPAVHRYVQLLMRKVFLHLIAQFKHLGGKIVYATFNKVIICTNKSELESAEQYMKYVLDETRQNPLFMWLDLEPRQYWATLLFKDRANYGGIPAVDKENAPVLAERVGDDNGSQSQVEHSQPQRKGGDGESIISHWNMAEFLPTKLQDHFIIAISSFIVSVHKNRLLHYKLQKARKMLGDASEANNGKRVNVLDQRVYSEEDEEASEVKELKEIIPLRFMQKLFTLVQDIQKITVEISEDQKRRRGRYQSFAISKAIDRNPTLEFIKFVSHAMSLDKTLRPQTDKLRKSLLKLINVMPFSQEAQFQEPCQSFRLPVICAFCSATRDVDLLRDADLLQGDEGWRCMYCKHSIDKQEVETRLVSIFQKHCLAYQFQDVMCKKCKTVKADFMGARCKKCSTSEFVPRIPPSQFRKRMRSFLDVAEVHQFDYLRGAAEDVLYE